MANFIASFHPPSYLHWDLSTRSAAKKSRGFYIDGETKQDAKKFEYCGSHEHQYYKGFDNTHPNTIDAANHSIVFMIMLSVLISRALRMDYSVNFRSRDLSQCRQHVSTI